MFKLGSGANAPLPALFTLRTPLTDVVALSPLRPFVDGGSALRCPCGNVAYEYWHPKSQGQAQASDVLRLAPQRSLLWFTMLPHHLLD